MSPAILTAIFAATLVVMTVISYYLRHYHNEASSVQPGEEKRKSDIEAAQSYLYTALIVVVLGLLLSVYLAIKGTLWEGHLMEWLNIVIRLMHFTFGIAWIGASFYFVFLENALNRTDGVREELAGNLWAVHGGGFYYLEKYKVAPKTLPKHLHWFKYEAYFTWLTGLSLLWVVYYFNAKSMLIDPGLMDLGEWEAIIVGITSFVLAWLLYDRLCRSPLAKNETWFAVTGFVLMVAFAWLYANIFSARAAYIHFGAMLGSLMAANVFFIIIPSQKTMVASAKNGIMPDPAIGKHALMRSIHNNYFTLPVLFVMVSNHFPSTFGHPQQWLVLSVISAGAMGVKHYLNLREKGQYSVWILPVSVIVLLGAAFMTAPARTAGECRDELTTTEIMPIIREKCAVCHSTRPTDDVYTSPPNGLVYETPDDIIRLHDKIMQRVVVTKTMPPNNKTNLTDEERDKIRCWIEQGTKK